MRSVLISINEVLLRHQGFIVLFSGRPVNTPTALDVHSRAFAMLRSAGLEASEALMAMHFGLSVVLGHHIEVSSTRDGLRLFDAVDVRDVDDPVLAELLRVGSSTTAKARFAYCVDLVVGALRSLYTPS